MDILKLFVDFNNADRLGRVRLNTHGTFADIDRLNIELKENMQVLLNDDTLTTIGNIKYSREEKIWVAEINWNIIDHNEDIDQN